MSERFPKYLVIPAAGRSSRYPNVAPKFLLSHPSGPTMLEMSVSGLDNLEEAGFSKIFVVSTEEQLANVDVEFIQNNIHRATGVPCQIEALDKQTQSVIETLELFFSSLDEDAEIVIKDCDNFVSMNMLEFDKAPFSLAYASLRDFPKVSAPNKSYVQLGEGGVVINFVEKQVISEFFSVGMVKFSRISDFLAGTELLSGRSSSRELYLSDLVRALMYQGLDFFGARTTRYEDWGTLDEWVSLKDDFKVVVIDADSLFEDSGLLAVARNRQDAIQVNESNLLQLISYQKKKNVQYVILGSFGAFAAEWVSSFLSSSGLENYTLVSGLYDAPRTMIASRSNLRPSPSISSFEAAGRGSDITFEELS